MDARSFEAKAQVRAAIGRLAGALDALEDALEFAESTAEGWDMNAVEAYEMAAKLRHHDHILNPEDRITGGLTE